MGTVELLLTFAILAVMVLGTVAVVALATGAARREDPPLPTDPPV